LASRTVGQGFLALMSGITAHTATLQVHASPMNPPPRMRKIYHNPDHLQSFSSFPTLLGRPQGFVVPQFSEGFHCGLRMKLTHKSPLGFNRIIPLSSWYVVVIKCVAKVCAPRDVFPLRAPMPGRHPEFFAAPDGQIKTSFFKGLYEPFSVSFAPKQSAQRRTETPAPMPTPQSVVAFLQFLP